MKEVTINLNSTHSIRITSGWLKGEAPTVTVFSSVFDRDDDDEIEYPHGKVMVEFVMSLEQSHAINAIMGALTPRSFG